MYSNIHTLCLAKTKRLRLETFSSDYKNNLPTTTTSICMIVIVLQGWRYKRMGLV